MEDKYVVVCQPVDEQYQDAQKKCEALKEDTSLGRSIKAAATTDKSGKEFRASQFRDKNKIWQLLSYFFKRYPVNLNALFSHSSFIEFGRKETASENIQSHEDENQTKTAVKEPEDKFVKPGSIPPEKLNRPAYTIDTEEYVSGSQGASDVNPGGQHNFDIGVGSLGIADLLAVGTELATYKNKWWWHRKNEIIQKNSAVDSNQKKYIPVSEKISQQESLFLEKTTPSLKIQMVRKDLTVTTVHGLF